MTNNRRGRGRKPGNNKYRNMPNRLPVRGISKAKKNESKSKQYRSELLLQIAASGLPTPDAEEYIFHVPREGEKRRLWRLDLAYVELRIGIELHGAGGAKPCDLCRVPRPGRHHTLAGFREDRNKSNTAQLQGWIVIECSIPEHIRKGFVVDWIKQALELRATQEHNNA